MNTQGRDNIRWIVVGALVVLVIVLTLLLWQCDPRAQPTPKEPVDAGKAAVEKEPRASTTSSGKNFVGKWSGKWDNTYEVHFTVTQDPQTQHLNVRYEWEETLGQPLKHSERVGALTAEVLRVGQNIEITISPTDRNAATAVGHFKKPRTAKLLRE
jgi:hypothetical protein